jgi:nucleotide-binding universal stress UspA family protein
MGALDRSGMSGLFIGNTAKDVLQEVRSCILTVKRQGIVSPVQGQ